MASTKLGLINFWKQYFNFRDEEVKAFTEVKREDFIPETFKNKAYLDAPLPLLRGKTISQPTTVMIMTAALEIKDGEKIFEVGTGSGYQAAILAKLAGSGKVVSTEVIPELVGFARTNLKKAKIKNVDVYEADGSRGFEKEGEFDKIIITAACKEFPQPLLDQLKIGGIIIGPVGSKDEQIMIKATKLGNGRLELEFLGPFLFTPMYGRYGFEI